LKFNVDNSDEIEEDVDGVKYVVIMTIEKWTFLVFGFIVMVSAVLEDSVVQIYFW
jgi:hypothetical protein